MQNTKTFTYDAASNLLTAADGNGAYNFTYDVLNRVETVAEPFSLAMTFAYDAASNRTSVVDNKGGVQTSIYDVLNRLDAREFTGNGATLSYDFIYTARSQESAISRYSDLTGTTKIGETTNTFDALGRMTNQ